MKKLRVVAMAEQRDELLRGLLHLGCVEVSEPDGKLADPAWSALLKRGTSDLAKVRTELADANTALDAIKRYGQTKEGMFVQRPSVSEQEFLDADSRARAKELSAGIGGALQEISRLQGEENRLLAREAALRPWMSLDMPLELEGTAHTLFRLGTCPGATDTGALRTDLAASDAAAEVYEINADKQQKYYLLICHRDDEEKVQEVLRPYNFSAVVFQGVTGTAAENVDALEKLLAGNRAAQAEAASSITQKAGSRDELRMYVDRLNAEVSKDAGAERLLTDGTILFFEGWAPAERMGELEDFLKSLDCAWEASDPTEEETPEVPVQLKNNWFTRPLNMVTEMYSLPSYSGVDPNPLMAPFFIFFYGFMLADMGYGLLMMLASWFIMKKARPNGPTMRHMIPLMGLCGASTFIMGAMTGGFFGDLLPQLAMMLNPNTTFTSMPSLFSPLDDALAVLVGSLAIGLAQIFTGMAISMYRQIKRGEVMAALCNEGAWYLVFILFAIGILAGQIKAALIAIVVLLVLTQGYGKKGILGKLMGIFGSLYNNITGYFSDILSYSRLMALMLAGAVIAQVFNTLGGITGNVITFFIISMIGNALNFALNLLGCYVHDMRLQCLEYFSRFYEDGGKPFRPIAMEPKYVDIVKK
nr:V-type ATP synthase subunit I [uncultured Oscillibacter sp.]